MPNNIETGKNNKQFTVRFNLNMLIVGILTVLVFVSVVQTITLTKLIGKNKTSSTDGTSSDTTAGKSSLPAALQQVPQQVGGC
ncbi:hypothetical protein A3A46_03380 [Candidatus Roizmanbacteria bacterium RIFCSPLOWO2_01_FULL_37_13]|uniref:Uncharacterized protein n=1 Tax=Candidatus Roizmanbacteria bacterium RIFCSPHIGHO2_02_FULL_38_11 TaxID=1802039 RepID=A0A1F7GWX6_9BACT|nr:MAG: hypothetical protein A3C25_02215 [Candidatus Roizmanbacteria bacterium RIFCSPHIGHO2_02_FULL_38_11]OGK33686.1 MAG: hypothetical protein A3F58_02300 [Candidatus Roizmanbacteria bacterium RIFCSPHIGHO2_12_FULL_37_9b]OGK43169.1 MAG: hypothetical protein A3A46_03380 [Candidatus Roizmanbacteria bacterium RIFCSPLOWO2_01_FULL_37_13]